MHGAGAPATRVKRLERLTSVWALIDGERTLWLRLERSPAPEPRECSLKYTRDYWDDHALGKSSYSSTTIYTHQSRRNRITVERARFRLGGKVDRRIVEA